MARFKEGIFVDNDATFGVMQFSSLWREKMVTKEDGSPGDEVEERYYDLMCEKQGCMVRVGVPGSVPPKDFPYEADVILVNPTLGTIANATFNGADVDWFAKADAIVLAGAAGSARPPVKPEQAQAGAKQPDRAPGKEGH